jgi:hypothetical protein
MISFEEVWQRILSHAGEEFTQIRGGKFTYEVGSGSIKPDRTNQNIPKSQFQEAISFVPLENTVPVQHLRGPSYIFAIMMDERIRCNDW